MCCRLRSKGQIVLPVVSSDIAATLLPGGRTALSRFHIPLNVNEHFIAGIKHVTQLAESMKKTNLVIWDEAPMQHRHAFENAFENVDRSLRDIMYSVDPLRSSLPFGGITIVYGGDYRQILPVIPKASRAQVVNSSFNSSKLWQHCDVLLLMQNMRLSLGKTREEVEEIAEFSSWVLDIGNGTHPAMQNNAAVGNPFVVIPNKFLIQSADNPARDIVIVIYPDISSNLSDTEYLRQRCILTPTNAIVNDINLYVLDEIRGIVHTYFSQDCLSDDIGHNAEFSYGFLVEYLNSLNMPGLPKHELRIKVGSVIMLMRNLNQLMGLCNGTRMIVKKCMPNSILCEILTCFEVGRTHIYQGLRWNHPT